MATQKATLQSLAHRNRLSGDSDQNGGNASTNGGLPFSSSLGTSAMMVAPQPLAHEDRAPAFFYATAASSGASVATTTTTGASASAVKTTATTTTPNWCSTLTNATIQSAITADIADGTITYSEVLSLLNTVDSSGTVTASEFSDLKTIAANLNNGVTTSSYVTSITSKLIGGDAANAYWNGGSNTATALGNLAAGTTATQLSELIGKWFLGSDLPATGYTNVPYATLSGSLYGSTGAPVAADINQGYLGDCYFEASLAEVATLEPSIIQSMIQSDGNGIYGVRFYINGAATWVTVNSALPEYNGTLLFNDMGSANPSDLWACLVEKAYAELNASGVLPRTAGNSYNLIQGGWGDPITEITNKPLTYYTVGSSASAQSTLQQAMITALSQNNEVWLGSFGNATQNGMTTFVSSHAYSVIGYDSKTSSFIIRNPWGSMSGQYWLTTFESNMAGLYADNAYIAIATGGSAPVTTPALTSIAETPATGSLNAGKTVTFTLTMSSIVNVTGTPTLTLNDGGTATYAGGSGGTSLTFTYTVLAGQNASSLAVTAINLPNGAAIKNSAGTAATLSLSGLTQAGPQIDTVAPLAPTISGDSVNGSVVTLNGKAEANSTVTVFDGGTKLGTATTNASGVWSYTTGTLANGVNAFTATAADQAGNVGAASAVFNQTINVAPVTVSSLLASGTGITNGKGAIGAGQIITIQMTLSAAVSVTGTPTLTLNDGGVATYVKGSGTNVLTFNYTPAAGQNTASLAVTGVGLPSGTAISGTSGNTVSFAGAVATFSGLQIDTLAPNAPVFTNETVTANKATFTGTAEANSTVTFYDNTVKLGTAVANSSGAWSYTTGTLATGAHLINAKATDLAGNVGATSAGLIQIAIGGATLVSETNAVDTLIGTGGFNGFYVYNAADKVVQAAGGNGVILSTVNYTLPVNVDTLEIVGGATQGTGNNDSINYLYDCSNVASTLTAGSGTDTLYVCEGNGTTLVGGAGKDTFVFAVNQVGKDTITNFRASNEVLQFNSSLFANYSAAMTHTSQVGANTVITIDGQDTITLQNVAKTSLTANNFHFV